VFLRDRTLLFKPGISSLLTIIFRFLTDKRALGITVAIDLIGAYVFKDCSILILLFTWALLVGSFAAPAGYVHFALGKR
jgi:hypothetical protein